MGLKAKKSFEGKGKGFHEHPYEHSVNAKKSWDTRYKNMYKKPLTKKDATKLHKSRTQKAKSIDESKKAQTILKSNTYRANVYLTQPNRYDIKGIDNYNKKDYIKGGYADNKPRSKYNKKQLKMGKKVEMEHTNNPNISEEIASDHLEEIPDYYTRLNKMEKDAEKEMRKRKYNSK